MLLKQPDLLPALTHRLQSAKCVDLASAWATEGEALELLLDAKQRGVRVRAIVGTHGNTTTPEALRRLKQVELRLAPHTRPLFHPKVYIFRGDDNFAWVGSANLTGKGFEENEELVLETHEVDDIAVWFEDAWERCGPLKKRELYAYVESYEEPTGLLDQRVSPADPAPGSHRIASVRHLTFRSDGKAGNGYRGRCRIERSDGTTGEENYKTHGDAVRLVLRALTRNWEDEALLGLIERDGPKRANRGGPKQPLLAKSQNAVYRLPDHKRHELTELEGANGNWWLTPDTETRYKKKLICFAAEHHGATVGWDETSLYGF